MTSGYAEDQAFGVDLLGAGWCKVYQPGGRGATRARLRLARIHAPVLRRVPRSARDDRSRRAVSAVRARRCMYGARSPPIAAGCPEQAAAALGLPLDGPLGRPPRRPARVLGAGLPSRAAAPPRPAAARRSEAARATAPRSRVAASPSGDPQPAVHRVSVVDAHAGSSDIRRLRRGVMQRRARSPLLPAGARAWRIARRLRIAMIVPPFRRGSGGHNMLFQISPATGAARPHLQRVGKRLRSGLSARVWPAVLRHDIRECFAPIDGPVYRGFDEWHGADVVLATGWQTVHPALRLDRCSARAYVVNDHEPEFYPTSAERGAGRGHLPARPALHRREPVAARSAGRAVRRDRRRVPIRRRSRRLPAAAGRPPAGHGRLLRATGDCQARRARSG